MLTIEFKEVQSIHKSDTRIQCINFKHVLGLVNRNTTFGKIYTEDIIFKPHGSNGGPNDMSLNVWKTPAPPQRKLPEMEDL